MIGFTVITTIRQDLTKPHVSLSLGQNLGQIVKVVGGSLGNPARRDQMGSRVTDDRPLRPTPSVVGVSLAAADEVGADVPRLQARGIQRPLRGLVQQMQAAGTPEDGAQQSVQNPFFPSRCSA